jgi:transcriptional regulator
MYTPKQFAWTDSDSIQAFCRSHPFAVLVAPGVEGADAQHLPVLIDRVGDGFALHAHAARANPILDAGRVLVIFNGPHAFVDAAWYQEEGVVPTWNYLTVHMHGKLSVINDASRVQQLFAELAHAHGGADWATKLDADAYRSLSSAITWFRIDVDRIEAKAKLSQHHAPARRERVIEKLHASTSAADREIGAAMARTIAGNLPWPVSGLP